LVIGVRSLEAIAAENAVEGVVRETFGAAVALWQAKHARDAEVRAALRRIADDECRHAELSWRVARWARTRLPREAHARIDAAARRGIGELRREVRCEVAPAVREHAGLPCARDAIRLLSMVGEQFWSM
jgi:hypothetical protein